MPVSRFLETNRTSTITLSDHYVRRGCVVRYRRRGGRRGVVGYANAYQLQGRKIDRRGFTHSGYGEHFSCLSLPFFKCFID